MVDRAVLDATMFNRDTCSLPSKLDFSKLLSGLDHLVLVRVIATTREPIKYCSNQNYTFHFDWRQSTTNLIDSKG
jgi:hypothetical protein